MSNPIRVAILGQGRSGRDIHGALLSKLGEYKIIAVSDVDETRRARAVEEYKCEAGEDCLSFLGREDIDLIINALPSHLHAPITLEYLRNGQNVLTEKPTAATAEEVDRLTLTAKSTGAGLYFFQNLRFATWFTAAREILASGVLGRPVQYALRSSTFARRWDWQTLQCNMAGSLRNTGPHPMDQAVVLMNTAAMPEVFCHFDRVNTFGDAEDFAKVILRVPGGPIVDLEISSCDRFPGPSLHVSAQYGTLKADAQAVTYHYYDPASAPKQVLIREPIQQPDGTPAYCRETLAWTEKSIDMKAVSIIGGQPAAGPVEMFYKKLHAHIRHGAAFEITAEQVRLQVAIMEECHRQFPQATLDEETLTIRLGE
jgi:predicted dehydrogenase